jgi:hypothetical protein
MRATILDADALRAISPSALAAYARGEGWQKAESYGAHADVYGAANKPEIVLPRTDRLGDYPTVISKLIAIFAKATEQDELATYRDLVGADRDVVRIRSFGGDDDGSVLIDAGVKIVSQARDMLLAAACAARLPQPLFRLGANKEATDYMRRVKLGQTEHGSFVVTLLAPVPPLLQLPFDPTWAGFDDEPFERQVTRRLVDALDASRNAVELAASGEGAYAFENAVEAGVSANLCEAVASLIEQSSGLDISLTWARTRPTPESHRKIAFSPSDAEFLKEAARTFRARHPKPDVSLFGTVHKLKRDQEEVEGLVTLKAIVDDRLQSVRAVLDQANYSVAVRAHDQKTPVIVKGDLERVGQRWQLTNACVTGVGPDDGADDDSTP